MNWLLAPTIPRRQWRPVKFQEKRAITFEEHQKILAGERNEEWQAYYEMLWHPGGSQSDAATLQGENVDWKNRTIAYSRMKTGSHALIRFGESVGRILQGRPKKGLLFPQIGSWKESDRAKAFSRRRALVGIIGLNFLRASFRTAQGNRGRPREYIFSALCNSGSATVL